MPNARTFPFRWVLPLAQLCLCAAMLWPMWPGLTNQVEGSLREYGLLELRMRNLNAPPRPIPLDFSDPQVQRIVSRNQLREWIVLALNGPGCLPELLQSIVTPGHHTWSPRGMFFWTWRDISWPVFGMFFWWLAGRGIEALLAARSHLARPKIGWWEVILAISLLAYGGILAIGMVADRSSRETLPWQIFVGVGLMWFAFGMCTIWARVLQWHLGRSRLRT
jgi:hypothetical protein